MEYGFADFAPLGTFLTEENKELQEQVPEPPNAICVHLLFIVLMILLGKTIANYSIRYGRSDYGASGACSHYGAAPRVHQGSISANYGACPREGLDYVLFRCIPWLSFPFISSIHQESEAKDEEHLKDLNMRQIGKLKETQRQAIKTAVGLEERNSELQNQLFRRKDEIDALKASFRLNQTEYNNWQVVLKQKEACLLSFCFYSLLIVIMLMRFLGRYHGNREVFVY
jgi:hypothetical protein